VRSPVVLFAVILIATALLTNTAVAGLGWTREECKEHLGLELRPSEKQTDGRVMHVFGFKDYWIDAYILDGKVSRVAYIKRHDTFSNPEIEAILIVNAPDAVWQSTKYDEAGRPTWWQGLVNSETFGQSVAYWAFLRHTAQLVVFDQDDRDHIKGDYDKKASGL
jgi:hypothetical protein